ncbi:MAG: ATP-binding protein [Planctomycetota bacterium]
MKTRRAQALQTEPHIHLRVCSDPLYLSGVRDMVGAVARRLGFDDLGCSQIALAVDEALCNVIRHGYESAADRPIWISLWPEALGAEGASPGITLLIEDEAKQIEPDQIKGRELEDIRPGGLGVHIIREVMDEVEFAKRERVGMRLRLVKRIGERPAEERAGA